MRRLPLGENSVTEIHGVLSRDTRNKAVEHWVALQQTLIEEVEFRRESK